MARRLAGTDLPGGVRTPTMDERHAPAYGLANGYDAAILIDAAPRGGPPGTLTVLEGGAGGPARSQHGRG